jgi:hypothetical protein
LQDELKIENVNLKNHYKAMYLSNRIRVTKSYLSLCAGKPEQEGDAQPQVMIGIRQISAGEPPME